MTLTRRPEFRVIPGLSCVMSRLVETQNGYPNGYPPPMRRSGVRMKARRYGSGTVYQVKSGDKAGRWVGSWEAPAAYTKTGGRKRVTVSAKSEKECRQRLNAKISDIMEHGLKVSNGMTVKAWVAEWLPRYQAKVAPKTYANAKSALDLYVIPTIGKKRLDDLTAGDIRAVHMAVRAAGNGSSTALRCHAVISSMLTAAVRDGIDVPLQAREVEPPKKSVSTRGAIPLDQARLLLAKANESTGRSRWVAALLQGMRPAEVLGLTWECVDLDKGTIDISWQLQTLRYIDRKDKAKGFQIPDGYEARHLTRAYHLVRPKTQAGWRIIPMVPWMHAELKHLKDTTTSPLGLVWWTIDDRYGTALPIPISDKADRDAWTALQDAAKVRHTTGRHYDLYEARHTCATLLLEAKVDPKIIQAIMGHSDILVTHGYQHVAHDLSLKALEDVAAQLKLETPKTLGELAGSSTVAS